MQVSRASVLRLVIAVMIGVGQAWGFPMQPDIKVLLDQAKQPRPHYVPARAGWNGPEEKQADAVPNPTYDELLRQPSAAEVRQQLIASAVPDWRVLLLILSMIVILRVGKRVRPARNAPVLA